jgi:hypothetical protein
MQHVGDRPAGGVAAVERPAPVVKEDEFTREVRETLERTPGHAGLMRKMREAHAAYTRATGLRGDETTEMAWLVRAPLQGPDSYAILPEVFPGLHARYVKGWRSEEQLRLEDPQLHAWFRDTVAWHEQLETAVTERVPVQPLSVHGLLHPEYEIVCCARSALGIPDFDTAWLDNGATLPHVYGAPDTLVASLRAYTRRRATMYDELVADARSIPTARAFAYQEITEAVLAATDALDRSGWTPWDDFPWLPAVYLDSKDTPARIVALYMTAVRTHVRVPLDEICPVDEVLRAGPFHWVFLTTLPASVDLRRDLLDSRDQLRVMLEHMLWATHALLTPETAAKSESHAPHVGVRRGEQTYPTSKNQKEIDKWYIKFLAHVAFSNLLPFVGYETDNMSHPAMLALRDTLCRQLQQMDYGTIFAEKSGNTWREGMVAAADRFAERVQALQTDAMDRFTDHKPGSQSLVKTFTQADREQFQRRLDATLADVKAEAAGCPLHRPRTVNTDVAVIMSHMLRLLQNMPPLDAALGAFAEEQRIIAERMHAEIMRANTAERDGFFRTASTYAHDRAHDPLHPRRDAGGRRATMSWCLRGALEVAHVLIKVNTIGFTGRGIVHLIETLYDQRDAFSAGTTAHILGQALVEAVAVEAMHFVLTDWRAELVSAASNIGDDIRGFLQEYKDWAFSFVMPSETTELFQRAVFESGVTGTSIDAVGGSSSGQPYFVTMNNATRAQVGWAADVPRILDEDAQRAWKPVGASDDLSQIIRRTTVAGLHGLARAVDDNIRDLSGFDVSTRNLVNATIAAVDGKIDGYVVPFAKGLSHSVDSAAVGIWSAMVHSSAMSPSMDGDLGYAMRVLSLMNERAALAPTGIPDLITSMSENASVYDRLSRLVGSVVYNDEPVPGSIYIEAVPMPRINTAGLFNQTTALTDPAGLVMRMYTENSDAFRMQLDAAANTAGAGEARTLGVLYDDNTITIGDGSSQELSRFKMTGGTQTDDAPESFHQPTDTNRTEVALVRMKNINPTDRLAPVSWARSKLNGGAGSTGMTTWLDREFAVTDPIARGTFDANDQFSGMVVSPGVAVSVSERSATIRTITGIPKDITLGSTLLLQRDDAARVRVAGFVHPGTATINSRSWSLQMQERLREIRQVNQYDPRINVLLDMLQTQEVSAIDYGVFAEAAKNAGVSDAFDVIDRIHNSWTADRTYYVGKERHVLNTKTLAAAIEQQFTAESTGAEPPSLVRELASSALGAVTGGWVTTLIPDVARNAINQAAGKAKSAACLAAARMVLANLRYYETHRTLQGSSYYGFQNASAVLTTGVMKAMIRGYLMQLGVRGLAWLWNGDPAAWAHPTLPAYMPPWQRALATVTRQCTRVFVDGGHLFEAITHLYRQDDNTALYREMVRLGGRTTEAITRNGIQRMARLGFAATSLVALSTLVNFYTYAPVIAAAGVTTAILHLPHVADAAVRIQSMQRLASIATSAVACFTLGSAFWGYVADKLLPSFLLSNAVTFDASAVGIASSLPYIPAAVTVVLMFSAAGLMYAAVENAIAHVDTTGNRLYIQRVLRIHRVNLLYIHKNKHTGCISDQPIEPVEWQNILGNLSTLATASGVGLAAGVWFGVGAETMAATVTAGALTGAIGLPLTPLLAVAGIAYPTAAAAAGMLTAGALAAGVQQFVASVIKHGNAHGQTLSGTVDVIVQLTLRIRHQLLRGRASREHVPSQETIGDATKALHGVLDLATSGPDKDTCDVVREIMIRTLGLLGGSATLSHHVGYRVERAAVQHGAWLLPGVSVNSTTSRVIVHKIDRHTEIILRSADDLRAWVATVSARSANRDLQFTDPSDMYRSTKNDLKWPLDPNAQATLAEYLGHGNSVVTFMLSVVKKKQGANAATPVSEPRDLLNDAHVEAYITRHTRPTATHVVVTAADQVDVPLAPLQLLAAAAVYRVARGGAMTTTLRALARQLNDNRPTSDAGSLQRMFANMLRHNIVAIAQTPPAAPTVPHVELAAIEFNNENLLRMWQCIGAISPFLGEWLMRAQMPANTRLVLAKNQLAFAGPTGHVVVALPVGWKTSANLVVPRKLHYTALVPFVDPEYIDELNPSYNIVAKAGSVAIGAFAWLGQKTFQAAKRLIGRQPNDSRHTTSRAFVM